MPFGFTSLDTGEETSSDGTVVTASIGPASGAMLYVVVVSTTAAAWNDDNGPHVTVSGLGGTWTNIVDEDTCIYGVRRQLTVSRGVKGTAWGSGSLTITVDDGESAALQDVAYTVDEITGQDSADPDDTPVVEEHETDNFTFGDVGTVDTGDAVFVVAGYEHGTNNFDCTGYANLSAIGSLSNVRQIKSWYDDTSPDTTPSITTNGTGLGLGGAAWVINVAPPAANNISELPSTALTLTPNAPQAVTTESGEISQLPSTVLTLTPNAPQAVTTDPPVVFVMSDSSNITDGGEVTTAQLIPPGIKTTNDFGGGFIQDDINPTDNLDPGLDEYLEFEWCMQATAEAVAGGVYEFRVLFDGVVVDTISVTPELTIASVDNNVSELPSVSLTLINNAPQSVVTDKNISVLPSVDLTLTTNAPQAITTEKHISTLVSAALTLVNNAPQAVTTEKNISVLPSADLSLTANAPQAIATEKNIAQLATATLTLAENAPQTIVTEGETSLLPSVSLTLIPNDPQAVNTENHISELPSASLTLTPNDPQTIVTQGETSLLPSVSLTIVPNAPQAVVTENNIATLPSIVLTIAVNNPSAVATEKNIATLPSAVLTLTPNDPQATTTEGENEIAQLPSTALTITPNNPTVEAFQSNTSQLPSATLTLVPNDPQAVTTEKNISTLPSVALALTPNNPQAVSTDGNIAAISAVANLVLTAFNPLAEVSGNTLDSYNDPDVIDRSAIREMILIK